MVRIRRESKLRPGAVRVPVPSESGSWTVTGWAPPPVRVSVRSFLEWVPGPGRYRKPTLKFTVPYSGKPYPRYRPYYRPYCRPYLYCGGAVLRARRGGCYVDMLCMNINLVF
jgi:hypothetical protein